MSEFSAPAAPRRPSWRETAKELLAALGAFCFVFLTIGFGWLAFQGAESESDYAARAQAWHVADRLCGSTPVVRGEPPPNRDAAFHDCVTQRLLESERHRNGAPR